MFTTAAADVARKAVKETKDIPALRGDEAKVYAALETLQDADDRPQGFSPSEIIKESGDGGRRRPALMALADRKLITYGRDAKGRLLNGNDGRHLQFRLPTGPNDFEDVMLAADEDLEN
jgi:hypothetical protein